MGKIYKPMSEKNIIWWKEQRTQGKYYWIGKTALTWGVFCFSMVNLLNWLFGLGTHLSIPFLLFWITSGIFVGIGGWIGNEKKYRNYLLNENNQRQLKS